MHFAIRLALVRLEAQGKTREGGANLVWVRMSSSLGRIWTGVIAKKEECAAEYQNNRDGQCPCTRKSCPCLTTTYHHRTSESRFLEKRERLATERQLIRQLASAAHPASPAHGLYR